MEQDEILVVAGAVSLAVVVWAFVFRSAGRDIATRSWVAAGALTASAVAGAAVLDRAGGLVGPISSTEVLIGVGAGLLWVAATQVGAALLQRVAPSFSGQTADLYQFVERASAARLAAALAAMAIAEELLFRGLIQASAGLPVAAALYSGVQLIERRWPLVLAAALGSLLWGGLYAWRDGVVAPSAAHAVWTVSLALIWPIRPAAAARGAR